MEEAHSLDRKNFQDNNSNINQKPKKCYVEEVVNDSKEYQNALLTNPEDNNDSSMIENEPIYINVQQNSNDQNIVIFFYLIKSKTYKIYLKNIDFRFVTQRALILKISLPKIKIKNTTMNTNGFQAVQMNFLIMKRIQTKTLTQN